MAGAPNTHPANPSKQRHIFGVGKDAKFTQRSATSSGILIYRLRIPFRPTRCFKGEITLVGKGNPILPSFPLHARSAYRRSTSPDNPSGGKPFTSQFAFPRRNASLPCPAIPRHIPAAVIFPKPAQSTLVKYLLDLRTYIRGILSAHHGSFTYLQ